MYVCVCVCVCVCMSIRIAFNHLISNTYINAFVGNSICVGQGLCNMVYVLVYAYRPIGSHCLRAYFIIYSGRKTDFAYEFHTLQI